MATYKTETVHTLVVTADNGAEYRIPVPHDHWSPVIGPYVRDHGECIAFAVYPHHPGDFEWPEYLQVNPIGSHGPEYNLSDICLARYRTHAEDPIAEAKANGTAQLYWFVRDRPHSNKAEILDIEDVADGAVWHYMVIFDGDGGNPDTRGQLEDILDDRAAFYDGEVYEIIECHRNEAGGWDIEETGPCIGWENTKLELAGAGPVVEVNAA